MGVFRFIIAWLVAILLLFSKHTIAAQCSAVFPDVIASHTNSGNLNLASGVSIVDNLDNVLQTPTLTGGVAACNGEDCSASGRASTPIDIPFRTAACNVRFCDFPMFGITSLGLRGNSFGHAQGRNDTRITFNESPSEYFFDRLTLLNNNEVTFNAGQTYYINNLSVGNNVRFLVRGSFRRGPARIILGNSVNFPQNVLLNSPSRDVSGDVSQLLIYGHGAITIGNNSAFSGLLYSRGSLSIGSNGRLNGVASAQNMSLGSNARATYNASVFGGDLSGVCDIQNASQLLLAHYQFEQDSWPGALSVIDSSSNANNGSPRGISPGRIVFPQLPSQAVPVGRGSCQVMQVPQNNDNLEVALNTRIHLTSRTDNQGTISFWYKADQAWQASTQRTLFDASIGDGSDNTSRAVFFLEIEGGNSGRLRFVTEDNNDRNFIITSQQGFNFSANTWVHIALSWNLSSRSVTLRLNGTEQGLNSNIEDGFNGVLGNLGFLHIGDNASFNFGFGSTANSAAGQFDDVRVYNFVQTASQVTTDRNAVTPCPSTIDHYRITHSSQGVTCEPLSMQIRACADASCSASADVASAITLAPSGFSGANVNNNTVNFSGSETTDSAIQLARTSPGDVTITATNTNPTAPLRCFNGSTETSCVVSFTDTALIMGRQSQVAERDFTGVNLRFVETNSNTGACQAAVQGNQRVEVRYDCDTPDFCQRTMQVANQTMNAINRRFSSPYVPITLNFNAQGIAEFSGATRLRYDDAGQILLEARIFRQGREFNTGFQGYMKVRPDRLRLTRIASAPIPPLIAGRNISLRMEAVGALGGNLPNYFADGIQIAPFNSDGDQVGQLTLFGNTTDVGNSARATLATRIVPNMSAYRVNDNGRFYYQDNNANYSEYGDLRLNINHFNYIGSESVTSDQLNLATFLPSHYNVSLVNSAPRFVNTHNTFTYIGQPFSFSADSDNSLAYRVQAINHLGNVTNNYDNNAWLWNKTGQIRSSFQLAEQSGYMPNNLVILGNPSEQQVSADVANLDGDRTINLANLQIFHTKVATPVSPFNTDVNLSISPSYFTDTVSGHTLCYRDNASSACRGLTVNNISGANMRYGRLQLLSNQTDENQALFLPVQVEYFNSVGNFVVNTEDSQTVVNLASANIGVNATENNALVSAINRHSPRINARVSNGRVTGTAGVSMGTSGVIGQALVNLMLDSTNQIGTWRYFLNVDRDNDGDIDNNDQPQANATFGRFRGNDRIILWREQL